MKFPTNIVSILYLQYNGIPSSPIASSAHLVL